MSIDQKSSNQAAAPATVNIAAVLGKTIREQREAEGLTLDQLSWRSGFHTTVLRLIEEGTWIPAQDEITVLAEALNCDWLQLSFLAAMADAQAQPRFVARPLL
jgi:ribosome-binding protein aMBF1 (putative translation factor)